MSNKLTLTEMVKLGAMFGLPFVVVLGLAFLANPVTFVGKMLMSIGEIFCYIGLVMIMLYLMSPKCISRKGE